MKSSEPQVPHAAVVDPGRRVDVVKLHRPVPAREYTESTGLPDERLRDLQRKGVHGHAMGDVGRGRNHQTAIRKQRERDGATGRSGSMTQQPRRRTGKRDGVDLPAQRKSGGGAGLEMEWRLEQPDGFSR